jgi:hypothetical protein
MKDMQLLSFNNLAQRVLYRYAYSFADFIPIESNAVSVDVQHVFHKLCESIVRIIADDPTIIGLSIERPDEWMIAHDVMSRHPELYKVRNDCQKAFVDLSFFLFSAGLYGEYRNGELTVRQSDLPKCTSKTLTTYTKLFINFGLHLKKENETISFEFPKCPEALASWHLLSAKCSAFPDNKRDQAVRFMLWMHSGDGMYFLERIRILLGLDIDLFAYITDKYQSKGYHAQYSINEYTTNYIIKKDVGGLCIAYATLWPTVRFVNETSIGIKAALEHANELDDIIKHQLVQFCKPCNNCMVCTKGGKNKQFTITVQDGGKEYRLCPEFVQMEWYNSDISTEKIDFMLELNELQEQFGKNWKKKK